MVDNRSLTRVGIFYDGNFFSHVSNYYRYSHTRRSRISISGLHNFIRQRIAVEEGIDVYHCQIVDAHYFRGRLPASEAEQRDLLLNERKFEDVLIREGIVTHYLPLTEGGEKGIDVWFALEAYELAIHKRFDVTVLIAGDSDFVPLVRKLNTLGTRVMVLGWDFRFVDRERNNRETRTSQALLEEVTYPILMNDIIDDRTRRNDPAINNLFIASPEPPPVERLPEVVPDLNTYTGKVQAVKEGFGFITPDLGGENLFFHYRSVVNTDFNALKIGDPVQYLIGQNDRGPCAIEIYRLLE
jgi:cold shock CspA family protein/uncharacterized LabA/DUF88 family protein